MPVSRHSGQPFTVDRAVPAAAATVILLSIVLVAVFGPWWLFLTGFVALNLAFYAWAGWCPVSLLLEKVGMERYSACAMPARTSS